VSDYSKVVTDSINAAAETIRQLRTDRDELRGILIRMLKAYAAGHVVCNVPDSQWWPALEAAQYLLGAQQETQLIKVATEARP